MGVTQPPATAQAPARATPPATRLAPSPTGALHLGNARTFLINWALARQHGWTIHFRMEDLDGPRLQSGADRGAMEVLRWLGIDWDTEPLYQSADMGPYAEALESLRRRDLVYPCRCTRSEIQHAQSAPHAEDGELRYPGTCRPGAGSVAGEAPLLEADHTVAWRVRIRDEALTFEDQVHGLQRFNVQQQVGDFVVASKAGRPAYQLAVVVDDARQQVTEVVRADDLLASTARQLWLYRLLGLGPEPRYYHLPLVVGEDGRRLAKRHGDTRLQAYRERGVDSQRVIGLLAAWSGIVDVPEPMTAEAFGERFGLERLPRGEVVFTAKDEAWLLER